MRSFTKSVLGKTSAQLHRYILALVTMLRRNLIIVLSMVKDINKEMAIVTAVIRICDSNDFTPVRTEIICCIDSRTII